MLGRPAKRKSIVVTLLISLFVILVAAIALLAICFAPVFGDQVKLYPGGPSSYLKTGDYEINPSTILADLDRGETNLFTPILATPESPVAGTSGSFTWRQIDFLKVANALDQFVWKEPIENWNLYSMQFKRECQNNPEGFDSAEFTFYRTIEVNGNQVYTAHGIGIYPLFDMVSWGGDTNFPHPLIFGWESIDLKKVNITADDALQIAEQSGGQNARSKANNVCRIFLTFSTNSWYVLYYSGDTASSLFSVRIDAGTGKYKVLSVKN